jgi:hypothetical protein
LDGHDLLSFWSRFWWWISGRMISQQKQFNRKLSSKNLIART